MEAGSDPRRKDGIPHAMPVTRARIERNLHEIRDHIAAACARTGRSADPIRIVAVTKSVEMDAIKALLGAGLCELGENRVQHLVRRAAETDAYVRRRRNPLPAPVR